MNAKNCEILVKEVKDDTNGKTPHGDGERANTWEEVEKGSPTALLVGM